MHRRYDSAPSVGVVSRSDSESLSSCRRVYNVRIYSHQEIALRKECVACETDPSKSFLAHDYVAYEGLTCFWTCRSMHDRRDDSLYQIGGRKWPAFLKNRCVG